MQIFNQCDYFFGCVLFSRGMWSILSLFFAIYLAFYAKRVANDCTILCLYVLSFAYFVFIIFVMATLLDRIAFCRELAVQERLNRSICRLDCGLGWAEGSTSSVVFARWRQCAQIGATWPIRLNRPSAAATRSYVKLLWPLVSFHSRLMSSLWAAKNS